MSFHNRQFGSNKILQRTRTVREYVRNLDFINQNEMQGITVIEL